MSRGVIPSRAAYEKIREVTRRVDTSADRMADQQRRNRAVGMNPYEAFVVLLRPNGGAGGSSTEDATWRYHCISMDGVTMKTRVNAEGYYHPNAPLRFTDIAQAGMQPVRRRMALIEYEQAPPDTEGLGYFSRRGDFVLLEAFAERPMAEDACGGTP